MNPKRGPPRNLLYKTHTRLDTQWLLVTEFEILNFLPSEEDDTKAGTPSPNYDTTSKENIELNIFDLNQSPLHGGSSEVPKLNVESTFDNRLPMCAIEVEEIVDLLDPMNSDSKAKINIDTPPQTITFSKALHCLETGKHNLCSNMQMTQNFFSA
ncbi:hypothetical protein TNCV_3386581 [Trichonephila clavipes]|nr:hypothetical protein TNCV_3386581 [Trichonephila clavipes]